MYVELLMNIMHESRKSRPFASSSGCGYVARRATIYKKFAVQFPRLLSILRCYNCPLVKRVCALVIRHNEITRFDITTIKDD